MRVAFIAVNYNNYLISLNNVSNILSLKGDVERDVIIVDNASDEKDYHALKEGFIESDHTFLVRSDKNLGYFGGLKLRDIPNDAVLVFNFSQEEKKRERQSADQDGYFPIDRRLHDTYPEVF